MQADGFTVVAQSREDADQRIPYPNADVGRGVQNCATIHDSGGPM